MEAHMGGHRHIWTADGVCTYKLSAGEFHAKVG
jgi:hypothetical protein